VDAATGAVAARVEGEEATVTVTTEGSVVRGLAGQAFVALDDRTRALIADPEWKPIIGRGLLTIPGGAELDVIDDELEDLEQRIAVVANRRKIRF